MGEVDALGNESQTRAVARWCHRLAIGWLLNGNARLQWTLTRTTAKMPFVRVWLCDGGGVRVPVGSEGIWIGRDPSCAIVVGGPSISRRHVLIVSTARGPRLIAVRKHGVAVNGRAPTEDESELVDGDELAVGSSAFVVQTASSEAEPAWSLERAGTRFAVRSSPFRIGGSPDDDLVVEGWPAQAATLLLVDGAVVLESGCGVMGAGRSSLDEPLSLGDRDVISLDGIRLRLCASGPAATTMSSRRTFPVAADLEFLPNGGLLRVDWGGERAIWISDRRCDLVAALLSPSSGTPGEYVSDETIQARIWPGEHFNRLQLNTLVYRLRQTLTAAGVDGAALIERAPGGRGTRIRLEPGARVSVK